MDIEEKKGKLRRRTIWERFPVDRENWIEIFDGLTVETFEATSSKDLGEIVGQPRPDGAGDDLYLLYIRAKIIQNRTAQTAEETLELISFMLGGSAVRYFIFSWRVE